MLLSCYNILKDYWFNQSISWQHIDIYHQKCDDFQNKVIACEDFFHDNFIENGNRLHGKFVVRLSDGRLFYSVLFLCSTKKKKK